MVEAEKEPALIGEGGDTELIVACQTCSARLGNSTQKTVSCDLN